MAVPYAPPRKEYTSLERLTEIFPGWHYQLYLRRRSTNDEVAANVSAASMRCFIRIDRRDRSRNAS